MAGTGVYISENYSESMTPQHNFANTFDLSDPERAVSSYARVMHEHTKRQLTSATNSARRRSQCSTNSSTSLSTVNTTGS